MGGPFKFVNKGMAICSGVNSFILPQYSSNSKLNSLSGLFLLKPSTWQAGIGFYELLLGRCYIGGGGSALLVGSGTGLPLLTRTRSWLSQCCRILRLHSFHLMPYPGVRPRQPSAVGSLSPVCSKSSQSCQPEFQLSSFLCMTRELL